jgi:hypothetical protein
VFALRGRCGVIDVNRHLGESPESSNDWVIRSTNQSSLFALVHEPGLSSSLKHLHSLFVSLVFSVKPYDLSVKILDSWLTYHEYSNMKMKSPLIVLCSVFKVNTSRMDSRIR